MDYFLQFFQNAQMPEIPNTIKALQLNPQMVFMTLLDGNCGLRKNFLVSQPMIQGITWSHFSPILKNKAPNTHSVYPKGSTTQHCHIAFVLLE